MILYVDTDKRIYGYNPYIQSDTENEDAITYEGSFSFEQGEEKEGYKKVFYFRDGKIEIEYESIPESEPTLEEQILSGVNSTNESQLILIEALATQYEEGLENDLNNKEVLATIYEELLAQREVK